MDGERYRQHYTCSICGEPGWVYGSFATAHLLRSPPAQHASCRNLVGYIKSVRHWEDRGYPQLAEEVRRIIADIWADHDPPAVPGFQQDLARRFLAGEDIGV